MKEKEALTPDQTARFWRGSLMTGAGLASLAALIDLHRSAQRAHKAKEKDPDGALVLHIPSPAEVEEGPRKRASDPGYGMIFTKLGVGLGLTGVSYALLQSLYNKQRKRVLNRELQDAATAYVQELSPQSMKFAQAPPSLWDWAKSMSLDTALATALLGGVGSYAILNNTFPATAVPEPAAGRPKKIVVKNFGTVHADGPGNGPLGKTPSKTFPKADDSEKSDERPAETVERPEELAKAASITLEVRPQDRIHALELLSTVTSTPAWADGSSNIVADFVGARARDKQAFDEAVGQGVDPLDLMVGGGDYFRTLDESERALAIKEAAASPRMRPLLATYAMSELNELHPGIARAAAKLAHTPEFEARLSKAASVLYAGLCYDMLSGPGKQASALKDRWAKEQGTLDLQKPEESGGDSADDADSAFSGRLDPIDAFMLGRKTFDKKLGPADTQETQ
jgi:hypothetical protein